MAREQAARSRELGEFFLYDEYDPRRAILFNANGTTWGCTRSRTAATTASAGADAGRKQYFLNVDANDAIARPRRRLRRVRHQRHLPRIRT